jgi:transcriptional regulator with XRE-family HTH domain
VLKSTISKHQDPASPSIAPATSGSRASRRMAAAIGREVRRRRLASGYTQAELGRPLTRAYVSAIELGYVTPSLATLAYLVARLGVPLHEFFKGVNPEWTAEYHDGHELPPDAAPPRRRR